jgi:hypothetical protein
LANDFQQKKTRAEEEYYITEFWGVRNSIELKIFLKFLYVLLLSITDNYWDRFLIDPIIIDLSVRGITNENACAKKTNKPRELETFLKTFLL